jgi:uncharacterized protein
LDRITLARRIGLYIVGAVIVFYAGFTIWFKANETKLLYHTAPDSPNPADSLHLKYEEVSIPSEGAVLSCWIYPALQPDTAMSWILYFPGNGTYDGSDVAKCKIFHDLGRNVLAVRYRGYGRSTGTPSDTGIIADARACYNFLTTVKGATPAHIVFYGHSMGAGIAIGLATGVPSAGIVLEGSYPSMAANAGERYPFIPWSLYLSERYVPIETINGVAVPKLFLHAVDDSLAPISRARELFAKAFEPKSFIELRGGHNDAPTVDRDTYTAALSHFFLQVIH